VRPTVRIHNLRVHPARRPEVLDRWGEGLELLRSEDLAPGVFHRFNLALVSERTEHTLDTLLDDSVSTRLCLVERWVVPSEEPRQLV
jgi:hypothetical protein